MVSRPQQFEVMVMPNLYGNIIGNIGTGLVGGAGTTVGGNIGDRCAIFEQVGVLPMLLSVSVNHISELVSMLSG